ncbi:hypothetical protein EI94DRAFT_713456 [Lactarius quietus]|nr:hypothetical protein EI94DRAFT_713456 [Lactarius quietus]
MPAPPPARKRARKRKTTRGDAGTSPLLVLHPSRPRADGGCAGGFAPSPFTRPNPTHAQVDAQGHPARTGVATARGYHPLPLPPPPPTLGKQCAGVPSTPLSPLPPPPPPRARVTRGFTPTQGERRQRWWGRGGGVDSTTPLAYPGAREGGGGGGGEEGRRCPTTWLAGAPRAREVVAVGGGGEGDEGTSEREQGTCAPPLFPPSPQLPSLVYNPMGARRMAPFIPCPFCAKGHEKGVC